MSRCHCHLYRFYSQRTHRAWRAELDLRPMGRLLLNAMFLCKFNYQAQGLEKNKKVSVDKADWTVFFLFLVKT